MKKIVFLILIIIISISLQAKAVTQSTARSAVENFLQIKGRNIEISKEYNLANDSDGLFIFNLSEDGFVISATDDIFYPVIAYSWKGQYSPANSDDLQFRFIKEDIKLRRAYYQANPLLAAANQQSWTELITGTRPVRTFQQWPMDGTTLTGGWCETQWNQSGVFNQFCPLDNSGNRSVVGCVATAMAQIMHYHEYLGNPVFTYIDNYNSGWWDPIHIDNDHESNDFPDWNELNDYLDVAVEHYANGEMITSEDLAAFNYACGVSVEMSYSSDGSGAYTDDVASALRNKFDYNTATWSDNYGGAFYNTIAENMVNMKPCEFSIYTDDGNNGHAIVCDGYNTDDYYHLNYGWGTSNIGWYYIPSGMPSNYSIIGGAVHNIEGGEIPVSVSGQLSGPSDIEDNYVLFAGEKYCYEAYSDIDGNFNVPALKPGWYTVSAVSGRLWYVEQEILIDSDLNSLYLEMFNYDALDGQVTSDIFTGGTNIALYDSNQQIATAMADLNGSFSIPDILPGTYTATASLSPDYFGSNTVTVNPNNQFVLIDMEEYEHTTDISWAGEASEAHYLVPITISCAIKIPSEDLITHSGDIFNGIEFKCPIDQGEGNITAQLWKEYQLLSEQPIDSFYYGEEIYAEFPVFTAIEPYTDYYVGFKVETESGAIAWKDAGPRVIGKGAWFRINNWVELAVSFDFNFCIKANLITHLVDNENNETQVTRANHFNSCYPNPYVQSSFRNPATISFDIAKSGETQIDLYNLKGQKVQEIYYNNLETGKHIISWQPENLSTGIYFYRLNVEGSETDYQKTIIIK